MSLKRRNWIALILILLAAVCWTLGQQLIRNPLDGDPAASTLSETTVNPSDPLPGTYPAPSEPSYVDQVFPAQPETTSTWAEQPRTDTPADNPAKRLLGYLLSFAAAAAAGIAVFGLPQRNPICGPDGICFLLGLLAAAHYASANTELANASDFTTASGIVNVFAILLGIRELLGWIRAKLALSWCLAHRAARRSRAPQTALLTIVGWILLSSAGGLFCAAEASYRTGFWPSVFGFFAAAVLGLLCLWKYGADLSHFQKQLENYQKGLPITVGDGAFAQTEARLLEVQAQHEEALRTAVTSERFKVELISNVSHDLRTPLTAILGYSELLQREALSPEGQEQLRRLHQKAGYMNDLVESLFELTKVSSGVVESKKEKIDLVRLLEQTVGLFDDQLVSAGITVKRSHEADSIPVVTDGARMHQVFANLLGNAIKYALAGTRIYLKVSETESSYLVRMTNTASYEMDFQPEEIVQRFARGDKARSTKGSGLGLAIAQTYTESVGGEFRVRVDGDQFSAIVELPKTERNL